MVTFGKYGAEGFCVDNSGGTIIGAIGASASEMPVIAEGSNRVLIPAGSTNGQALGFLPL